MAELFDQLCSRPQATQVDYRLWERHRARLFVAGHAADADELRLLLDQLGLWPADDGQAPARAPASPFVGGGFGQRHRNE